MCCCVAFYCLLFVNADLCFCWQGVRLGVRPDAPPLPRPTRTVKVETGCNVGNPCVSSPCPAHSRCSDQWERHTCVCEPGKVQLFSSRFVSPFILSVDFVWLLRFSTAHRLAWPTVAVQVQEGLSIQPLKCHKIDGTMTIRSVGDPSLNMTLNIP